jgi:hypothetical protein
MLAFCPSRILPIALAAAAALSTAPARADDPGLPPELPSAEPSSPRGSRWIAALPFGIGQMQNGDVGVGIFFAAGEAVLAGASLATYWTVDYIASVNPSQRSPTHQPIDVPALNARITTLTMVNRATFAGWAALTAAGVFEAEVSFGPRHAARTRLSGSITAAPLPGGGMAGIRAAF